MIEENAISNKTKPYKRRFDLGGIVFFFIWPFGALIHSVTHSKGRQSKTIFWLFCVFFGFAFIIPKSNISTADSLHYAEALRYFYQYPLSFKVLWNSLYSVQSGYTDIYQPILTWLVANFTNNTRWLFTAFATVFGYFYAQNLWIVLEKTETKKSYLLILFLIGFALLNPIWNINGVRMWTAAHVFLYGTLLYFLKNDKKGLIWCLSTFLIHYSFVFPIILILIYIFLPKRLTILFYFYVITLFINEINIEQVRNLLSSLPEVFLPKVESYANLETIENTKKAMQETSWHIKYMGIAGRLIVYLWVIYLFFTLKKWEKLVPYGVELFSFGLYMGAWANLASLVPSGGRFNNLAVSLFYIVIIFVLSTTWKHYRLNPSLKSISVLLLLYIIIIKTRLALAFFGAVVLLGNPILASLVEDETPIIEFIFGLF